MIRPTLLTTLFLFGLVFANPVPEESGTVPIPAVTTSNVLKGVTIRSRPFVDEVDGKFEGFVVDVIDYIAKRNGFQYELYFAPDGRYGNSLSDGNASGMVGEVFNNKADFAIADLTVTEAREKFVDFTEPFLVNQLAALVKRDEAEGMNNLEDLVNSLDKPDAKKITFMALKNGATVYQLSKSEDPIAKKIYDSMKENEYRSFITDMKKGVDKVAEGGHAFIVESSFAEHEVINNCQLAMLKDTHNLHPRKFAIALPNGSERMGKFNEAIKEMIDNGEIAKLKEKYWPNNCDKPKTALDATTA